MSETDALKTTGETRTAIGLTAARAVLLAIIALGIVLRLSGLGWGIPRAIPADATPYRTSFHPDERTYIAGLLSMKPATGSFDVHDYHWGTLQFYLINMALSAARFAGCLPGSWRESYLDLDPPVFHRVYLLGRIVSALAGTLTLLVAFRLGTQLKDTDTGLTSAAFVSVLPLHVVNSHFLTSDVTMVLLLLVSFSFLVAWLKSGDALSHVAGAAALGLAISAKYNAALLIPVWVGSEAMSARRATRTGKPWWKSSALAAAAVVAGFGAGEPYAFVHVRTFLGTVGHNFFSSDEMVRHAMLPWPRLLFEQLQAIARFGMQWSLAVPAAAGLLACLVRPTKERLALAASVLLAIASLVFARWPMIRYTLPLVCLGAIAAALAVADMPLRGPSRLFVAATLCAVPLLVSLAQVRTLLAVHPANRASEWVYTNVPDGSRIGQIWPELPPLDRRRYDLVQLRGILDEESAPNDSDRDLLILDNLPIRPLNPDFLVRLNRDYVLAAEFGTTPRIGRWAFDEQHAPHDWKYTHPVLRIFRRKPCGSERDGPEPPATRSSKKE